MDIATGTIVFTIDLLLASDSGRPKHTDVTEQGAWVADHLRGKLKDLPSGSGGAALGDFRYYGEVAADLGEPVWSVPAEVTRDDGSGTVR